MSTSSTGISSDHRFRRRLVVELLSVARALFWIGVLWFALGSIITFIPGGEQSWFTVAAVLTAFGFLVPQRSYRIAALFFVVFSSLAALDGHKRGIQYRKDLESVAVTTSRALKVAREQPQP